MVPREIVDLDCTCVVMVFDWVRRRHCTDFLRAESTVLRGACTRLGCESGLICLRPHARFKLVKLPIMATFFYSITLDIITVAFFTFVINILNS